MSLERLIEEARRKRSPEEQAQLDAERQDRMTQFNIECSERHRRSIPTQEQLHRVIDYGIRNP